MKKTTGVSRLAISLISTFLKSLGHYQSKRQIPVLQTNQLFGSRNVIKTWRFAIDFSSDTSESHLRATMTNSENPYQGPPPPLIPQAPPPISHPPPIHGATSSIRRLIFFNGVALNDQQLNTLQAMYRVQIPDGSYWYDNVCGAWGWQGGPCAGFIMPNLGLGGPLRPDASSGNTGVFINGRQLHLQDVLALQQFTVVQPGRFWVDAQGNFGFEGGPLLGNLVALAQAATSGRGGAGSGDNFWCTRFSAGNYDPNSGSGYVSVPGYGPIGFGPG
jgi:hypothetical protein